MSRKTGTIKEGVKVSAEALDRLFAEIDPMIILAGGLGGIAAANGIIPPFTRLLMLFEGATGAAGQGAVSLDLRTNTTTAAAIGSLNPFMAQQVGYATIIGIFSDLLNGNAQNSDAGAAGGVSFGGTDADKEAARKAKVAQIALFSSGALEAMMMMELMRHPDIMKTIIQQPAEMLKGIGEIVPG